jgi:cell division transport system permease protein
MRAQFVLQEIWIGLRRNLTMTVALIVVVAISLSLLGTGLLFIKQVDSTRTYWQGKVEVSIYLCTSQSVSVQCKQNGASTPAQRQQIQQTLSSMSQVAGVTYESQAQAYSRFKQEFSNSPSFVSTVQQGDIPDSFQVKLKNPQVDYNTVATAVTSKAGVVIIALVLLVAATLLVANTIRLSAFNRRRETGIMRLVGASNFYIQLPFLLEGVIAGLIGWAVAAGLLIAVKSLWLDNLQQYFTFNVGLSTGDLVEVVILAMCVGVVLCGATSFLTLRRYLRI